MKKNTRWILIGSGSFVALALAGTAVFLILQAQMRTPLLDLIPASRTVALFEHTTLTDAQTLAGTWLPVLTQIPRTEGWISLAIVEDTNGTQQWIMTPGSEATIVEGQQLQRFHGKSVYLPAGLQPDSIDLRENEDPLSADARFLSLAYGTQSSRWTYVRDLPPGANVGTSRLDPVAGPVFLEFQTADRLLVRSGSSEAPGEGRFLIPQLIAGGTCIGTLTPNDFLKLLSQKDDPLVRQSIATAEIERLLNADVSYDYDIAPLLGRPVTSCRSGDAVLFLGDTDTVDGWNRSTAEWHASYREHAARGTIDRRTVDEKYTYEVVKTADAILPTTEKNTEGWSIRESALPTGTSGLFTARKGARVLVATSREWLEAGLALPVTTMTAEQAGSIDPRSLNADRLSPVLRSLLPLLPSQKFLVWSQRTQNGIVTLTLEAK